MATATRIDIEVLSPPGAMLAPRARRWRRLGAVARANPLGVFGLVIIVALVVFALFAPLIAPYSPDDFVAAKRLDPSWQHLFGTDNLGRDMFSRVVYGARISLIIGFSAVIFGTLAGTAVGIISGYMGGRMDAVIQRTADLLIAFPALLLLLILRQVMGPSMMTLVIAIGIAIVPGVTRVVRGAVLSERNNQYVEAARALGASTPRVLFLHIAPNVVALSIIVMTSLLGSAVLAEASLSFLGLGLPNTVTWGSDVNAARNSFPVHVWWAFFPGAAITLTVLGFSLCGDSLRDIFDPRLRGRT
jgi:ABC-type dipeptide/oligopeptide/nickel transport system permease subunit